MKLIETRLAAQTMKVTAIMHNIVIYLFQTQVINVYEGRSTFPFQPLLQGTFPLTGGIAKRVYRKQSLQANVELLIYNLLQNITSCCEEESDFYKSSICLNENKITIFIML